MDCEKSLELLLDRTTGNLDPGLADELAVHLSACPRCRAEAKAFGNLWDELGGIPAPEPGERVGEEFHRRLHASSSRPPAWVLAAAAAFLVVLGGLGGYGLGRAPAETPTAPGPLYLLLLHEPPMDRAATPEENGDGLVAEYTAWARALAGEGKLVRGEKLADAPGRWIARSGDGVRVTDRDLDREHVGGFFLIRAGSYDEAVAIARTCPHVRVGSGIEVRKVEGT